MSHYNNYGGGGGGGYNNYGRNNYNKINEEDVPASKHSIFIRGLPATISFDEIKDFFEEKIGPCSFDFQKVNQDRQLLFVAVRFETREAAKEAYYKYREEDILGCRCEVTWFRDIRRFISYQQTKGNLSRYTTQNRENRRLPARYYGNGRDQSGDRRRRYSDEPRSRSGSRSDRSKSARSSKSKSRSRSLSDGERRSTSKESDRKRSESRGEDRKRKKEKKAKKSKKDRKRSRRSGSASSKSDGERSSGSESEPDEKKKKEKGALGSRQSSPLRLTPPPPAPFVGGPIITLESPKASMKISIASKAPEVESTAFKMQLDSDEPPKRIVRPHLTDDDAMDVEGEEDDKGPKTPPPPEGLTGKVYTGEKGGWRTVNSDGTVTILTQSKSGSPSEVPVADSNESRATEAINKPNGGGYAVHAEHEAVTKARTETHVYARATDTVEGTPSADDFVPRSVGRTNVVPTAATPAQPSPLHIPPPRWSSSSNLIPAAAPKPPPGGPPPPRTSLGGGKSRFPECSRLNGEIKAVQDAVIAKVKSDCSEALSLSDLNGSTSDSLDKMEERERMVASLSNTQRERFEIKKKQLLAAYRKDCDTFGIVVSTFLSKDPTLMDALSGPLLESLEGMERAMLAKVDAFLEMQNI